VTDKLSTLCDLGELAIVERIRRRLPQGDDVLVGAGDDCAVVRATSDADHDLLLTSDAVIEGVHFDTGTPFDAVGHKAVGRVLSDIAAMGGQPGWALLNISAPADMTVGALDELYAGALALAGEHDLAVVGGDVAEAPALSVNVFATGSVPAGKAILRSGARAGDLIYVTGTLGGSRHGRHLSFEPRVAEGLLLRPFATSMIDISDGLATDLAHLLRGGNVGARIEAYDVPVSAAAAGRRPFDHAMTDGEDYELLFTIAPVSKDDFLAAWNAGTGTRCTCIGVMNDNKGIAEYVAEDGSPASMDDHGFSHFD